MTFISPFNNDQPQPGDKLDAETMRLLIEGVQRMFRLTTTHPLHVDINESGFHFWLDQPLDGNALGDSLRPMYRPNCIAGVEVREVSHDGGATWTIDLDLGVACGDGLPCRTIFSADTYSLPGPCLNGLDYVYIYTTQLYYDARGCLQKFKSSPVLTRTDKCCTVCGGSSSGAGSSSGTTCAGTACPYCATTTPCQYTFNLTCPDFGTGVPPKHCKSCIGNLTPLTWSFVGAGFGGDFAAFNITAAVPQVSNCGWELGNPGGVGGFAVQIVGSTVRFQLLGADGVTYAEYRWTAGATPFDCCSPITVTLFTSSGAGALPATLVLTPAGCAAGPACTPDPSGGWTLTQLATDPCSWVQIKPGVVGRFQLLYDPIDGVFEGEVIIAATNLSYVMVFTGYSAPGLTTFDCTSTLVLALVDSTGCNCSNLPLNITLTPVAKSAACCNIAGSGSSSGTGGGVTSDCCPGVVLGTSATAVVTLGGTCNGSYPLTYLQCSTSSEHAWVLNNLPFGTSPAPGPYMTNGCDAWIKFVCGLLGSWQLVMQNATAYSVTGSCSPFSFTATGVDLTPFGGLAGAKIVVTIP